MTDGKLTALEMCEAIVKYNSANESCFKKSNEVLAGKTSLEEMNDKPHGSFMTAVFKGDYLTAMARADNYNRNALLRFKNEITDKV